MSKCFCPTSRKYSFWVLRNSFFFNLLRLGVFRNLLSGFSCISVILILLAFYRGMDSVDFGLNSTFNSLLVSIHNLRLGIVLFGIFVFIIHHVLIINFTLGSNLCLNYEGTIRHKYKWLFPPFLTAVDFIFWSAFFRFYFFYLLAALLRVYLAFSCFFSFFLFGFIDALDFVTFLEDLLLHI